MNRRLFKIILIIWFLSSAYLLLGAVVFNRASSIGLLLIAQSQLILLAIILISTQYIFPNFWRKGRWLSLIGSILLLNLICVVIRYFMEEILFVKLLGFPKTANLNPLFYLYENFYYTLPGFFIALIIFLAVRSFDIEKRNNELYVIAQEAELNTLKSQINPHFLYNILNYVYSEALPISEKISRTILKLASTMRYTLDQGESKEALLGDEIQFLQEYIDLQAVQHENGFYCYFSKAGAFDEISFPTFILLPFVENAFKHGVVDDPDAPIKIDLKADSGGVWLKVENKINGNQKDKRQGIGIVNVKRRLDILYPDQYTLEVKIVNNHYCTELAISL